MRTEGVLRRSFINKYDSIIDKINIIRTSKNNRLELIDYENLISLKEHLRKEFEEALKQESNVYKEIELLEALVKVAYQIWGGTFQTIESVVNFFSILFDRKENLQKFFERQEKRVSRAKCFATKKLGNEAVLIEYIDKLLQKTKEAWYK